MHCLLQASRLASKELVTYLAPHGCSPVKFTPSLWTHKLLSIIFTLAVDIFSIKLLNQKQVIHLKKTLKTKYAVTINSTSSLYAGVSLD